MSRDVILDTATHHHQLPRHKADGYFPVSPGFLDALDYLAQERRIGMDKHVCSFPDPPHFVLKLLPEQSVFQGVRGRPGIRRRQLLTYRQRRLSTHRQMGTGLLVTELMGFGVNGVTGDYSRGAAGFWVENGAIQYPVEEITIAGNLKDMFRGLVAVGNDVDRNGNIRTGSILIESMTLAGS